ncbi:MAG: winged helix-turn-helix transcriptional regulator [Conexivisphaerales archaeon]
MKCAVLFLVALLAATYVQQPSVTITVFPNGYVGVTENTTVTAFSPKNITIIGVPEGITVSYSNGSPALYSINGKNLTIVPDVNGTISVNYFTDSIVGKNNISWFISINTPYELKLILPQNASLVSMNSIPNSIGETDSSIYLILGAGNWTISYIMPPPSKGVTPTSPNYELEITATIIIVAVISGYIVIRRRKSRLNKVEVRELDNQIINYLKSKGGSAKESEIRQKLVIPKTTAWRAIKRLEREGKVKVIKADRENIIVLT